MSIEKRFAKVNLTPEDIEIEQKVGVVRWYS